MYSIIFIFAIKQSNDTSHRFDKQAHPLEDELKNILLVHSRSVTRKALDIAEKHPELQLNTQFIAEAAMLHDIGIGLTNAPGIHCHGDFPYICHGYLGADFLREAGYPEHALVCERHTGAGLVFKILSNKIFRFHIVICYRLVWRNRLFVLPTSFFLRRSSTKKRVEGARKSLLKHGTEGLVRFDRWCELFL